MTRAQEAAEQARLRFVAVLAGAIASGMKVEAWFALLDDELGALAARREAFTAEAAELWLEAQAQALRPRRVRQMSPERRQRKELRAALGLK